MRLLLHSSLCHLLPTTCHNKQVFDREAFKDEDPPSPSPDERALQIALSCHIHPFLTRVHPNTRSSGKKKKKITGPNLSRSKDSKRTCMSCGFHPGQIFFPRQPQTKPHTAHTIAAPRSYPWTWYHAQKPCNYMIGQMYPPCTWVGVFEGLSPACICSRSWIHAAVSYSSSLPSYGHNMNEWMSHSTCMPFLAKYTSQLPMHSNLSKILQTNSQAWHVCLRALAV